MARATLERKKSYKETVEAVLAKHDYSKGQFCRDMLNLIETMDKYWKPDMPTIDRGQGDNRDD